MHFGSVHSWLSQEHLYHLEFGVLQHAVRAGKVTYCRSHNIVNTSDCGCMLSVDAISFEDRFCASKRGGVGRGGRVSAWVTVSCTWQLPWLAVEQPWSALAATIGVRNFTCWDTVSGMLLLTENCLHVGSFQSGGAFAGQRALTIESSLMSGCG